MEWKKFILEHLVNSPNGSSPRTAVRDAVLPIAEAEGCTRRVVTRRFCDALVWLCSRDLISREQGNLTLVDIDRARIMLKQEEEPGPTQGAQCPEDGCERRIRSFGYCSPCAERLHADGILTVDYRGNPIPVCSFDGCNSIRFREGMCYEHRNETRSFITTGRSAPVAAALYDWVVINRFWHGRKTRALSYVEKVEFVRLTLRAVELYGSTGHAVADRAGMSRSVLDKWMERYQEEARAIGLESQLRFCFLPYADEPADGSPYEEEEELTAA